MNDLIDETRRLKSRAMDARDRGDFVRAIELLGLASRQLSETLQELKRKREAASSPGRQETETASQLCHILGSMGGVHRRNHDYRAAARAYDAGYEIEKPSSEYGIVNSYNLVQRLVTRVFLEPSAVEIENTQVEGLRYAMSCARLSRNCTGRSRGLGVMTSMPKPICLQFSCCWMIRIGLGHSKTSKIPTRSPTRSGPPSKPWRPCATV